jgi:hypothetical protein
LSEEFVCNQITCTTFPGCLNHKQEIFPELIKTG